MDDIRWKTELLNNLAQRKDMILSLAEARTANTNVSSFNDCIPGKTRRLNVFVQSVFSNSVFVNALLDVYRNTLVSVFLRTRNTAVPFCFLNINRFTAFNDAILSRMRIIFAFPIIELGPIRKNWMRFLEEAVTAHGPAKIGRKDLNSLSETPLNG
ncbi:uncharacterized protein BDW43DRAFT_314702 [Aspergillus alliaceus]|uniref:uncharacterized protein n=1 Tax=Petromyces alliaceus TaxID=209559 RepID=UPI0012A4D193|nr:uncharacterized protein BDW43DRAFT_314702 [Aspergillus alliaceus]KAB8229667.1 hypothetical protein BDW43DRAFT_314702 [Aspergillus alliaceus]